MNNISKSKKRKRIIIWGVIGLLILLAVAKRAGWIGGGDTIKVATEKVGKQDITEMVPASGKIQPIREVKISPDVSGEVVELMVKEGQRVKKGDVLAKIKPDIYKANYEQVAASVNSQRANFANAQARLAQAEAQFLNAESSYKRSEILFQQGAISQSEFDAAKAQYEVAKAEVQAARQTVNAARYNVASSQASMNEASNNLTRTTIVAPVDGIISNLAVEVGERVAGASQFSPGTEIITIADLAEMEVNVSVNENDVVRLSLGDTALIEVDAYPDRKFKGLVTEIANSASIIGTSVDQVSNFDVTVVILPASYADMIPEGQEFYSPFRPGMSASVEIMTASVFKVLAVPVVAVTTREDSASTENASTIARKENEIRPEFVFVVENGIVKIVAVKTGIQDNNYIQILEGLTEGMEVVVAPYSAITKGLRGGEKVKVVARKELFEV